VSARQWSLNERLRELGYAEGLDRRSRVLAGQAVNHAYKQAHGKAPAMAAHGRGGHATRVCLYVEADLPLVDATIRQVLGDPPGGTEEETPDAGPRSAL
jgi:hypothetical protein